MDASPVARYTHGQGVTSRPWRAASARYPASTMSTLLDLLDAVGDPLRRPRRARRCGSTTADHRVDLPRARATVADRRLAAPGAGPRAGRPDPDLVAVHPGAAGRLLRRDGRAARARAARPADVAGGGGRDRQGVRGAPPDPGHRPRRARTRARPASTTSRPRRSRRSAPSPPPTTRPSRPTGRPARPPGRRPTADEVFELVFTSGHHRDAEGRDADPRQRRRLDRVVPPDHPADGAPARLAAPAVAPARAGRRAVLRARCRRRHPLRAQPEPARHLRCAARPARHLDGRGPAGPRPVLERHRARGREARPDGGVRPAPLDRPPPADARSGRGSSAPSTGSWAGISACSSRPGRSCRRRSSRPGRTSGSPSCRATAPPRPGPGPARRLQDHGPGTVGRRARGHRDAPRPRRGGPVPRPDRVQRLLARTPRRPPPRSPTTAGTAPGTSAISTTAAGSSCRAGAAT